MAKQTGEPVTEIARRGFTILAALLDDADDEPQQPESSADARTEFEVSIRLFSVKR